MNNYLKVKSDISLVSDMDSHAIVNKNDNEFEKFLNLSEKKYKERNELDNMKSDLDSLKNDIDTNSIDLKEFKYKNKGNLAVIGRNKAVADLGYFTTKGFIAWILWIFIHICYLIGFDNKASVLIKWALNYFNQDKGTRLIFLK